MNIGVPKERRPFEFRVGLSPSAVEILRQHDHSLFIEQEAGLGAGFSDQDYEGAGARIVYSTDEVFGRSELILKIARPTDEEVDRLQPGSAVAGLLHLASTRRAKIEVLLKNKVTAIAYEQIREPDGSLPVLRPSSQIGGAMAAQVAARLLQSDQGGCGMLLGGIPGVAPAEVVILGAGTVGTFAARAFHGLGAHVTVLDRDLSALQKLNQSTPYVTTVPSTDRNIEQLCPEADVLVGAVLVPGERAPLLVSRETVRRMKPRSVIIDISIDQGGCIETSRPTTHDHPTYIDEGVVHYCVPNMPGVVARTSTHGVVNAALPYIQVIADQGVEQAVATNPAIEAAVNTFRGEIRHLYRFIR